MRSHLVNPNSDPQSRHDQRSCISLPKLLFERCNLGCNACSLLLTSGLLVASLVRNHDDGVPVSGRLFQEWLGSKRSKSLILGHSTTVVVWRGSEIGSVLAYACRERGHCDILVHHFVTGGTRYSMQGPDKERCVRGDRE